jgi:hypothetical protein
MDRKLTDQELTTIISTKGCETGQGETVVDELAVECAEDCSHNARIAKGGLDIKRKVN